MTRAAGHVRALAWQAPYVCQRRGACCARGWPIPVEMHVAAAMRRERLEHGIENGHLARDASGRCVFLDGTLGERTACRIQTAAGVDPMPLSCRHFPRLYCLDPESTSLVLSHACETVAADLESPMSHGDGPLVVELDVGNLPAPPEGLDGKDVMPPLLAPEMMASWDALTLWEEQAVGTLVRRGADAVDAVAMLIDAAEILRRWAPGERDLLSAVGAAFDAAQPRRREALEVVLRDPAAWEELRHAVASGLPDGNRAFWQWERPRRASRGTVWQEHDGGVRRFIAAHAWASWPARMGQGLRTAVADVVAALTLLEGEYRLSPEPAPLAAAALRCDLLLRHLASPPVLTRLLGGVETTRGDAPLALSRIWRDPMSSAVAR